MIFVDNISKSFSGISVLRELSFTVKAGETVALLGLSGSGKTTALKTICGLHVPDTGKVVMDGVELNSENLSSIRRQIGYVIQDGGLFPHLTAFGNLKLVAQEAGITDEGLKKRVLVLSEMTKIPFDLLKKFPRQLSGGQRQRIGIMRALLLDPNYLLLDEPMGALDPITREELQEELKELFNKLGKTVVLVTHDLSEAMNLSNKIILLNEGKIAQEGHMDELLMNPADEFVKRFVRAQKFQIRNTNV